MLPKLDCWKKVLQDHSLLQKVADVPIDDVAVMSRLRKKWSIDEITVASELVTARKKAVGKLSFASTLASDIEGVQQATSSAIAKHKAERFFGYDHIVDLCCGVGADLHALPPHAVGVDCNSLRCWMAEENTKKIVHCGDATTFALPKQSAVHIDPARRNSAGRIFTLEDMVPSFSEVVEITKNTIGGCIKLSPAINPEDVAILTQPIEIEYIEEKNRLVQAVLWYGALASNTGEMTATSMKLNLSISGKVCAPRFSTQIHDWILEPNVALERAGLHGTVGNAFGASELSPGIGLLSAQEKPDSPWFTCFEVVATTSLRIEKVASMLREHNCTQVEVKTRGKTIDPNAWQKKLNKKASGPLLTLFALRLGNKRVALLTRRYVIQ